MMSKVTRKVFLIALVFVILFISFLLMNSSQKEKELAELNNNEATSTEESIVTDNENTDGEDAVTDEKTPEEIEEMLAQDPRFLASEEAREREAPYPGLEEYDLEFMSEEEKEEFEIPFNREAQILSRDFEGKITSFKQIRQAEDIVYPY